MKGPLRRFYFWFHVSYVNRFFTAGSLVLKEILHGVDCCRGELPGPQASPRAALSASEASSHGSQHMPTGNKAYRV